jgi:hypothetical protein
MAQRSVAPSVGLTFAAACALSALLACAAARAASAQSDPHPIPQVIYAACDAKASGDGCVVHIGDREIRGTCEDDPSGSRLLCMPNDPPTH